MPLIQCPDCHKAISDRAPTCPNCGYPIAEARYAPAVAHIDRAAERRAQRKLQSRPGFSRSAAGVLVVVFIIIIGSQIDRTPSPPAAPSCRSDWRLCNDNADLMNNHSDISWAQASCEVEAKKLAKYGTPKFNTFPFGSFQWGDSYVKTGIAILVEKDAQFSNAFGAMVHTGVTCRYDLNSRGVLGVQIGAN